MPDSLPELQRISHYRLLKKLGMGGMGEVFLAEDTRLNRYVALKLLPAEYTNDASRLVRFHHEARAASSLNHPSIITIYEIGQDGETCFIATEYIDGVTLRQKMDAGRLGVSEAVDLAIEVAGALVAAHEVWIVHRDIKPENIMIRRDGYVKVLDFGLAKLTEPAIFSAARIPVTQPGTVMGTVEYMAPEQLRGQEVDARADIFALGVLLYEMVTGTRPFEGSSTSEALAAVLTSEPPSPRTLNPAVPPALDSLVTKALAKNRDDRYATARDLLLDLKKIRQSRERISDPVVPVITESGMHKVASVTGLRSTSGESATFLRRPATVLLEEIRQATKPLLVALLILLAALAGLTYFVGERTAINSIAVLPFENVGKTESTDYLSDGLTESVIRNLSQLPNLQVMAASTVFHYKGQRVDPRNAGRDLKVRGVITGKVFRDGKRVIVDAELVDVDRGTLLWGEQFRRNAEDIVDLQEELSTTISDKLRLKLSGEQKRRLTKHYTENSEAFETYLKGVYFLNKRTAEGFNQSITYFWKAIELDPNFALAYAGIADGYNLLASYGDMPASDGYLRAEGAAKKALAIDPDVAEAHAALAYVYQNYEWNWDAAEREYRKALELNPNNATAHHWYGGFLMLMGRPQEALQQRMKARELDPLSPIISLSVGSPYLVDRKYPEAIAIYRRATEIEPRFARGYYALGLAYLLSGDLERGVEATLRAVVLSNTDPSVSPEWGFALAKSGKKEEALAVAHNLEKKSIQEYVSPADIALIYATVGDQNRAIDFLEKGYHERSGRVTGIYMEATWDPLRGNPRFQDLVRRMAFPSPREHISGSPARLP